MVSVKIKIHPLTFVFAFFYAASGKIGVFLVYTVTALIHETGHAFVANKLGYRLNKICLMPFGAVINGENQNFSSVDEIKIAVAGPMINFAVGLLFVAVWWVFPDVYPYTDLCAEANFAMAFVNFLPAYPLDGGRVLCGVISLSLKREVAFKICKTIGVVFSAALFGLFVVSCFFTVNVSLLFFALFVLFGALSKEKDNVYLRFSTFPSKKRLKKGVPIKRQAVDKSITVKELVRIIDVGAINEIVVYDDSGKAIKTLLQKDVIDLMETGDLYSPVSRYLIKP